MIYTYCVRRAEDPGPPDGLEGIEGAAVVLHRNTALGMWISEIAARPAPTEAGLRAHERVVRTALMTGTPLPLRFGTVFPDLVAVEQSLTENTDRFVGMLGRVSGRVEMGIRVEGEMESGGPAWESPIPEGGDRSTQGGRAYLERRRAEIDASSAARKETERVLGGIEDSLSGFVVETTQSVVVRDGVLGHVACLVQTTDLSSFRTRVADTLVPDHPAHRIVVSGPWAPYSFVNE